MKFGSMTLILAFLVALAAGSDAVRRHPGSGKMSHKSLEDLKQTLEKIKSNIISMKPSISAAALMLDAYTTPVLKDTPDTVDNAFTQLYVKKIPATCLKEATLKLNEIQAAAVPNCSTIHIIEDLGSMAYSTVAFAGLSMVTLDEVLNGLQECGEWYWFWNFIPCFVRYAWNSYEDLYRIVPAAFQTWTTNEKDVQDILKQIVCKATQVAGPKLTTAQVLSEADVCAKNSS